MKKINVIFWYLPLCFFIFLATYTFIKFIFIFFFNASFQPEFLFDLTPYYLLSGTNNLHLVLLSLFVIGINAYLHFKISKKNLIFSFIPTAIMLAGIGFKIALQEIGLHNVLHYLMFGFLLVIVLVDHRHILILPEIKIFIEKEDIVKSKPFITKNKPPAAFDLQNLQAPLSEKPLGYVSADELLTIHKETLSEIKSLLKDDLQKTKILLEELKLKASKIDILEEDFRNKKHSLTPKHTSFAYPYKPFFEKKENDYFINKKDDLKIELKKENQSVQDSINIDRFDSCVAIIKRGILKEVNRSFADLLGFDKENLLEKSLLNFVAPEGLFKVEEYYLKRLKGNEINSYNTILLTNNNDKIKVEIFIKPIKINGGIADIAIIKQLKKL